MAQDHSNVAPVSEPPAGSRRPFRHLHPSRKAGRIALPPNPSAPKRLLSHREEIELARTIEEGNRCLAQAVSQSPAALDALITLLEETERATPALEAAAAVEADEADEATATASPASEEPRRDALLRSARRLRALGGRRVDPSGKRLERARADLVETALEHGLPAAVVDRLVAKLIVTQGSAPAQAGRALEFTIRTIRESQRSTERAKATFVRANLGLVAAMARRRRAHAGLSLPDLIQEGSMGLIRAVEKFDHRRGLRFSTYAAWWIRHSLNRALSDQSRTIRLPVYLFESRQRLARVSRDFFQEYGREPTPAELSQRAAASEEKIRRLASLPQEPVSLETPIGEGVSRLGDLIADPAPTSVLEELSLKQLGDRLRELVCTLTPREQQILRLRFGTDGAEPLTLQEIAQKFALSRERIRQIESGALSKLRQRAEAEDLASHLAS